MLSTPVQSIVQEEDLYSSMHQSELMHQTMLELYSICCTLSLYCQCSQYNILVFLDLAIQCIVICTKADQLNVVETI